MSVTNVTVVTGLGFMHKDAFETLLTEYKMCVLGGDKYVWKQSWFAPNGGRGTAARHPSKIEIKKIVDVMTWNVFFFFFAIYVSAEMVHSNGVMTSTMEF